MDNSLYSYFTYISLEKLVRDLEVKNISGTFSVMPRASLL